MSQIIIADADLTPAAQYAFTELGLRLEALGVDYVYVEHTDPVVHRAVANEPPIYFPMARIPLPALRCACGQVYGHA